MAQTQEVRGPLGEFPKRLRLGAPVLIKLEGKTYPGIVSNVVDPTTIDVVVLGMSIKHPAVLYRAVKYGNKDRNWHWPTT